VSVLERIERVAAAAEAVDGAAPLDEATWLALRASGDALADGWVGRVEPDGFGLRHDGDLHLVVHPDARGAGLGGALLADLAPYDGPLRAWSHGNHPAAAALAARLGFERVRDLWVMRRPLAALPEAPSRTADGIDVRTFVVGRDEDAFLAVNAAAFAHHPEQGGLTRTGLEDRMAEPWFDPAGFFVATRGDRLVGFHWTKVHDERPPCGEVYVVGVSPQEQGSGLGRLLTATGLHHLAAQGLGEVVLYVEAGNAAAVAVYERLGFTHAAEDTHVQYAR
jgi:mycothiol synthase